jgi:dihydroorotate dehydrogenase
MKLIEFVSHVEGKIRSFAAKLLSPRLFVLLYAATRAPYLKALKLYGCSLTGEAEGTPKVLFKNKLTFRNDLGNAAGLDKDGSLLGFNYNLGAGFAVVGTVLSEPHGGNVICSSWSTLNPWTPLPNSASAINSLGLPSKGIDCAVKKIKLFKEQVAPKNFPIGVSIMGHPNHKSDEEKLAGIAVCVQKSLEVADFIEINESCPNTIHDAGAEAMSERIKRVIQIRDGSEKYVPVLVKLADLGDVDHTVRFLASHGVDGVVIVNTQKNYDALVDKVSEKDRELFEYYTDKFQGGVSGRAIREFSFLQASAAAAAVVAHNLDFVVVHVGGISTPQDMAASRAINEQCGREVVVLREWYTGLMEAMGEKSWRAVYPQMLK